MIVIDEKNKQHILFQSESVRASESLINTFRFEMKIETNELLNFKMILVPYQNYNDKYSHTKEVNKRDIYIPNHIHPFVEQRINQSILQTRDAIAINFQEIPNEYSFMDLFSFNQDSIGSTMIDKIELRVISEEENIEEFSYRKEYKKQNLMYGIHIGTFAKVSDGWKFHPKFINTLMRQNKVLSLAIGEYYDSF